MPSVGSVSIDLSLNRVQFDRDLKALNNLKSTPIVANVTINSKALTTQVKQLSDRLQVTIPVAFKIDQADLKRQSAELRSQLKREFTRTDFNISVNADTKAIAKLNQQLDLTKKRFNDLSTLLGSTTLKLNVDGAGFDAVSEKAKRAKREYQSFQKEAGQIGKLAKAQSLSVVKFELPSLGKIFNPITSALKQVNNLALAPFKGIEIVAKAILNPIRDIFGSLEKLSQKVDTVQSKASRQLKLTTVVDDRALTRLNKHFDLKQRHLQSLNRYFKSSPLTPNVNDRALSELNNELSDVSDRFDDLDGQSISADVRFSSNADEVYQDISRLQSTTVNIGSSFNTASARESGEDIGKTIAGEVGKSIKGINSKSLFSTLAGGVGSVALAPFKLLGGAIAGIGGNVASSLIFSITQPLGAGLGQGLSNALESALSKSVGSSELFAEKIGGAIGGAIASGVQSQLKALPDILDKQIDKLENPKQRKKLKEKLAEAREIPGQVGAAIQGTIGPAAIAEEGLTRRGMRRERQFSSRRTAQEQALEEWKRAIRSVDQLEAQNAIASTELDKRIAAVAKQGKQNAITYKKAQEAVKKAFGISGEQLVREAAPLIQQRQRKEFELDSNSAELTRQQQIATEDSAAIPKLQKLKSVAAAKGDQSTVAQIDEEISNAQARLDVFTKSIQELSAKQAGLLNSIAQVDNAISAAFDGKSASKVAIAVKAFSTAQGQLSQSAVAIKSLQKQKATGNARLDAAKQQRAIAKQRLDQVAPAPSQPQAFLDIAKLALKGKFDPEKLPSLKLADASLKKAGAQAQYDPVRNAIEVTRATFEAIQKNILSDEQANELLEELEHAVDFDFGSLEGIQARRANQVIGTPVTPTPEELEAILPELGFYPEERRGFELNAKVKRNRDLEVFKKQQSLKSAAPIASNTQIFSNKGVDLQKQLALLEQASARNGKDVSELTNKYRAFFSTLEEKVSSVSDAVLDNPESLSSADIGKYSQQVIGYIESLNTLADRVKSATAKELEIASISADQGLGKGYTRDRFSGPTTVPDQFLDPSFNVFEAEARPSRISRQARDFSAAQGRVNQRTFDRARRQTEQKAASALAIAEPQPKTFRQKANDVAQGAGRVARGVADGAGAIAQGAGVLAKNTAATVQALNKNLQVVAQSPTTQAVVKGLSATAFALGQVTRTGYNVAKGFENVALDLIPMGRTIKGVTQQLVLPAVAFGAATQFLPGGQAAGQALTSLAGNVVAPFAQSAGGAASGAAADFIGSAVPNIFGLQGAITGAVTGAIDTFATSAGSAIATAGAAVLGGKALQSAVTLPVKGAIAGAQALVPSQAKALPPAQAQALPPAKQEVRIPLSLKPKEEPLLVEVEAKAKEEPKQKSIAAATPQPPRIEPPKPKTVDVSPPTSAIVPKKQSGIAGGGAGAAIAPKTTKEKAQDIAFKAGEATGQAVRTGAEVIQRLTRDPRELAQEAIAKSKELEANFASAYQNLQKAIKTRDTSAVRAYKETIQKLATQGGSELSSLLKNIKEAGGDTRFGSEVTQILGGVKGRLTQKSNLAQRNVAKLERERAASGEDLTAQQLTIGFTDTDRAIEAFKRGVQNTLKSLNSITDAIAPGYTATDLIKAAPGAASSGIQNSVAKFAEIEPQGSIPKTLKAAAVSPKGVALAKDLAVNAGGLIASNVAGTQGNLAGLGGDLIGALAVRQTIDAAAPYAQALLKLRKSEEFLNANLKNKAKQVIELAEEFKEVSTGDELFGDLAGFGVGNLVANIASIASGPVVDAIAPVPLKGAIAASVAVPQLAKLRDRITGRLTEDEDARASGADLSAQKLSIGGDRGIVRTLDSKRRLLLEKAQQQIGNTLDRLALLIAKQPDLIDNAKINRTLRRLNQVTERLLDERTQDINEAFERGLTEANDEIQAYIDEISAKIANLPDFGLLADRAIGNDVQRTGNATAVTNQKEIAERDRLINEQVAKGNSDEFAPIRLDDAPKPVDGNGFLGSIKKLTRDFEEDFRAGLLKRANLLVIQGQGLVGELESTRALALAEGDTGQAGKLGKLGDRTSGAVAEAQQLLSKSPAELTGAETKRLAELNRELASVFKQLNRPVPPDPGGFGAIADKVSGLTKFVKPLIGAFAGFASLQLAGNFLKGFTEQSLNAALSLDRLKTALNFASGGTAVGAQNLEFVRKVVDDLKIPLGAAQEGFKQLAASTRGTKVEGQATKDVFLGVSQAATVLGLTGEQTDRAFTALAQSASKGKVQAEELRGQLGEAIPGAFAIAARSMGVTEAELNKLLETGQVTSEEFLPKFAKQLQSEFGGAAVNASKDAGSAIFAFENSVISLQETFGKQLQPIQVGGLQAATAAIQFLGDRGDELATILTLVGTVIATRVAVNLGQLGIAAIQAGIGAKLATASFSGLAASAAKAFAGFAVQIAIAAAAAETFKTIASNFVPNDLGKQFGDFASQAESSFSRIEAAAKKARGEVEQVGKKPSNLQAEGFDLTLGLGGLVGTGPIKTDSLVTAFRDNVPGAKQLKGAVEGVTGGRFSPFTTVAEKRFNDNIIQAGDFASTAQNIAGQAFDSAGIKQQLGEVNAIDQRIKGLQRDRGRLAQTPKPDKNAIADIDKQIAAAQKEREVAAAPVLEIQNAVTANLQNAKQSIAAIDALGLPADKAAELKAQIEPTVKLLEKAERNLVKLQQSSKTAVDPVRELASAFLKVQTTLEEAGRASEKAFQVKALGINQKQLKGFSTDVAAARNANVDRAKAERDRLNSQLAAEESAFSTRQAALATPGAAEALGEISIDGKPITVNSSIAEIDAAKKTLSDKDGRKKQVLDDLKTFKESEAKLLESRNQAAQAELNVRQTVEQTTLQNLDETSRKRESAIQRASNREIAVVKNLATTRKITEEDAAIVTARIQEDLTGRQIDEAKRQLTALEQARNAGQISAEQYAQKQLELGDKISGLEVQQQENASAKIEAVRRKRLSVLEQDNRKAEAAIALSQTTQTTAARSGLLTGSSQEDVAIASSDIQEEAVRKRIERTKIELAQTQALRADGTLSAKEATEKEIALNQQLAESNGQLIDIQIQRQEQLRAAIARTFQVRREQLKLEQTESQISLQSGALAATRSGPVDRGALDLATKSQDLNLRSEAIANEINLLQEELSAIDALGQADQGSADKRRALAQSIADARLEQINLERETDENAREQIILGIERQIAAQKRASEEAIAGIQSQKDANDLLLQSLDATSKLLESRNNLSKSFGDLGLAQSEAQLKRGDRALQLRQKLNDKDLNPNVRGEVVRQLRGQGFSATDSEAKILERRQAIEDDIANKRLAALQLEQEFQRKSLEIDLQRQRISAENLVIEAEIAKLRAQSGQEEAKANLEIAKASGDTERIAEAESRLKLTTKEVELSDRRLGNAQQSLGIQSELEANSRAALGAQQQTQNIGFNSEQEGRESDRDLAAAEALAKNPGGRRSYRGQRASTTRRRTLAGGGAMVRADISPITPTAVAPLPTGVTVPTTPGAPVVPSTAPGVADRESVIASSVVAMNLEVTRRLDTMINQLGAIAERPTIGQFNYNPKAGDTPGSVVSDVARANTRSAGL